MYLEQFRKKCAERETKKKKGIIANKLKGKLVEN